MSLRIRLATLAALCVLLFVGAAQAQAPTVIPVPFNPSDPSVPHPAYNGHQTTLKAISREVCETPYFRWSMAGSPVSCLRRTFAIANGGWYQDNRYALDCATFLPEVDPLEVTRKLFVAQVEVACSVAADGTPAVSAFGSYPVEVRADIPRGRPPRADKLTHAYNAHPPVSSASCNAGTCAESGHPCASSTDCVPDSVTTLAIKRQVMVDDALWFLHKSLAGRSGTGNAIVVYWGDSLALTRLGSALRAFTATGHLPAYPPGTYVRGTYPDVPAGDWAANNNLRWATDPYAEDTARIVNAAFVKLAVQPGVIVEAGTIPGR